MVTANAREASLEQKITGLYVAFFDRAGDKSGLDYWRAKGESANSASTALRELSKKFAKHNTFISTYSSLDNQAFVEAIYRNALGEEGDSQGISFWKGLLDKGMSRSDMVSDFVELSLTVDVTEEEFPTFTTSELEIAQKRQDLLTNQVDVALYFTNRLAHKTDVADATSPENDPAYLASIKILENVTDDEATVSAKKDYIDSILGDSDPISTINGTTGGKLSAKDEPYYKYSWHINSKNSVLNSKGYRIDENADIGVEEAWKTTMGKGVVVAVIDDGADLEHEDLKANILKAYNSVEKNGNAQYIGTDDEPASHGNTCAGFIVAPINGKGVVGIAPESKVVVIKTPEEATDADVIDAFEYAKNQGAKVISCSWGTEDVSEMLVSELKSLYDAGVTVLFASGNEGASLDEEDINDESEVEWVIGVGASGENNDVTSYSNYGKNIDVIAPGGDFDVSSGILGLDDMGDRGDPFERNLVNTNYTFVNGTSFSTPITAGVVALMYAVNPNITPAQVKNILTSTADKIGVDFGASYEGSDKFDRQRAYGKINASRAVAEAKALTKK